MFANGTTAVGLIKDNKKSAYREMVEQIADMCINNNLSFNVDKRKRNDC